MTGISGRVIGINTLKQLTRKFEGLGLAIPIRTALQEFDAYLPAGNPWCHVNREVLFKPHGTWKPEGFRYT
ncbi:MAG: hypothetical protein SWH68_08820 [Thermodesulfobacteriota bacterium]|nr:hypothetical protein [Thermodesulfobacteriota bacterium]